MSQRDEILYAQIPTITFKCKECGGLASYRFSIVAITKAANVLKRQSNVIKPDIIGRITPAFADCVPKGHRLPYDVIFFKCKETDCNEYVLGTVEDKCIDPSRIFKDGKAKLKCIKGHEKEYSI